MKVISEKKQKLIDKYLSEPVKVGDNIVVRGLGSSDKKNWGSITTVVNIDIEEGGVLIYEHNKHSIVLNGDYKKWDGNIGEDPFDRSFDTVRSVNFTLDSIIYGLGMIEKEDKYKINDILVKTGSFNPFVYDENGKKVYYQRPLVWTDGDKKTLIDSIYNGIDCGKILIRLRGFDELTKMANNGETDLSFKDVVDGKQRLNAVKDFIDGKFCDSHGNYYGDLSDMAQRYFLNHQLFSYSELPEGSLDKDVKQQFLRLNFAGIPQSKEHLEFVKSIKL